MLSVYLYSIISVILVSAASLVGILAISIKANVLRESVFIFVSLAVGALLGDSFIHLIPEALEEYGDAAPIFIAVIVGIFVFFIMEKFLHWHHHEDDSDTHIHPVGKMILISDGLHNFLDGIIIGASYLVSIEIGIATTIAVILHEIPQEIGDFGVLIHSGYTAKRAAFLNFMSALTAIAGTILILVVGEFVESVTVWLVALAAGGFIYIAMSDLIPELHKTTKPKHTLLQIIMAIVGVLLMIGLLYLE